MTDTVGVAGPAAYFGAMLAAAARLPGVRIQREVYLRSALKAHCSADVVDRAIASSPASAGVSLELLAKAADDSIRFETLKVTALSTAAGIPGGFAIAATIPADAAQLLGHMLRVAQKLAYLYSWPDLFSAEADEPDDATQALLTLFVGVMFGATAAGEAVQKVAAKVAEQAVKELPKKALTHGVVYPIVKKVAGYVGVKMIKDTFANGSARSYRSSAECSRAGSRWRPSSRWRRRRTSRASRRLSPQPGSPPDEPGADRDGDYSARSASSTSSSRSDR